MENLSSGIAKITKKHFTHLLKENYPKKQKCIENRLHVDKFGRVTNFLVVIGEIEVPLY